MKSSKLPLNYFYFLFCNTVVDVVKRRKFNHLFHLPLMTSYYGYTSNYSYTTVRLPFRQERLQGPPEKQKQQDIRIYIKRFSIKYWLIWASQVALVVKNLPANAGDIRDAALIPELGRWPWRREWQTTPAFVPGKSNRQRNLVGYSPKGCKVRHH